MQFFGFLFLLVLTGVIVFILLYGMRIKAQRDARLVALYHKALESGVDPLLIRNQFEEREQGDPQGNLKAGIILLATALSMLLGLWAADRLPGAYRLLGFVLIPAGIGLACLFIHYNVPRPPKPG
jgi:hypothetical protein